MSINRKVSETIFSSFSDLICGPPPTKSTTTTTTTTRIPKPLPTIAKEVPTAKPNGNFGQRQNAPRRRNGVVQPEGSSFLSNSRRTTPRNQQKAVFNSVSPNPVKKFNSQSGIIKFFNLYLRR